MKRMFLQMFFALGLALIAAPLVAQKASTQAQQPGAWCQKCVVPGTCISTESGEWGYTICTGLGGNQCAAGGRTCMWSTGAMNVGATELQLASGERKNLTPLAPFVWTAADCEEGSLIAVGDRELGLVRTDAGNAAWQVMTLAAR